jgi:membrane protease YdiL (CAAX protease family)
MLVRSRFIVAAVVGWALLLTAFNLDFYYRESAYVSIYRATHFLLAPTLVGGALGLAFAFAVAFAGRLRPRDVGWQRSALLPGLAIIAVMWPMVQAIELAVGGFKDVAPDWGRTGWVGAIGILVSQIVLASGEETFFRGFLLTQLRRRYSRTVVAVLVSQLVFALSHVPNLVLGNSGDSTAPGDIALQVLIDFGIGVLFAALYLATNNLFLVIGVHALGNAGFALVRTPVDPAQILIILSLIVLVLAWFARRSHRGDVAGEEVVALDRSALG